MRGGIVVMALASEMKKHEICTKRENSIDPVDGIAVVAELSGSRGEIETESFNLE